MNYAPIEDVDKADSCAMLFIMAEKEEYGDNEGTASKPTSGPRAPKSW